MNPIVVGLLLGAVTTVARWARGKTMTVDTVVGVAGVAIGLAVVDQMNKDLAKAMGTLIVVSVVIVQGPAIFDAVSKTTSGVTKKGGTVAKP